ncbi:MAG: trehalose-6-phosphate synthase [Betaproteobacteria bacterium RIFCSPLOWO2_12_FULL_62_13]|nr:MAG: trehalose-6-phosphate synthase [Betaproteobacteria bacterium RIFCSPLOWO2_12_FULL_62_13]
MPGERAKQRLIVVSNRLPYVFKRGENGRWLTERGAGGLVSALLPVLRDRGGSWIGWPGTADGSSDLEAAVTAAGGEVGFALKAVTLDAREVHEFYHGFANEIIWPLFHDLQSLCNFEPAYWRTYKEVTRKFAEAVLAVSGGDDFIWVHDYHLMNVAAELRALGYRSRIGFFLHIPFPSPDIFFNLPWRSALLHALSQYDLVGFQTLRDRRNFIQCLRSVMEEVAIQGKGQVVSLTVNGRTVRVGNFPISIDYDAFVRQAGTDEVAQRAQELHRLLPRRNLILGVDRLDYTKGIPLRLLAFKAALERYPELRERISLIQVVVPSRVDIPQYHDLKMKIEQLVGEINGGFVRPGGWVPVWYEYGSLRRKDLLAYYRAADIALITPLKDGMNLVAKEYCACSIEEECVLILSEFAGAAAQLQNGALLVNPYDIEGVADMLHRAFTMSDEERRARMRRMRRSIRETDIFWWVDSFLRAAIAKDLSAFPQPADHATEAVPDYVPI